MNDELAFEKQQRGYAMSYGDDHPGLHGIATAALAGDRSPLYGAAISGPADRRTRVQIVASAPRLMASAKELADAPAHPLS